MNKTVAPRKAGRTWVGVRASGYAKVSLTPRSPQPLSFDSGGPLAMNAKGQVMLSDVRPGAHRLRVGDAHGGLGLSKGLLFEQELNVPTDFVPITVALGAGSIKGRFLGAGEFGGAGIDVFAVASDGRGPVRRTCCDNDGRFCMRYLRPGTDTLFAHLAKGSWARIDDITVASNIVDVGERTLKNGGTIRGTISFPRPCPVPDEVIAVGPSNVSVKISMRDSFRFDHFEQGGLWPGQWTITVLSGEERLAMATTTILGTEKVAVELAPEAVKRQ